MEFDIKPNRPTRQDCMMPQTFEQLIKKYKLDSMWDNIQKIVEEVIEQNSGYVVKKDGIMYIADCNILDNAEKVLRLGKNGALEYSDNGINGDYQTIISINGVINANFIKTGEIDANKVNVKNINADNIITGNLNADIIKGGILTLGGNNNVNGELRLLDNAGDGIATINKEGFVLENGTQLIGGNGVLSNLQFGQYEWKHVGYSTNYLETNIGEYLYINIPIYIPENFNIESAKITLYHSPVKWSYINKSVWGYCRNLKLYIKEEDDNYYENVQLNSEVFPENNLFTDEIINAFGVDGFTASNADDNNHIVQSKVSIDIKSFLKTNTSLILQIKSGNVIPDLNPDIYDVFQENYLNQTGNVKAIIDIVGKIK